MLMKIMGIIIMICGIATILMGIWIIYDYYANPSMEIVDCYDRHGNKIIGQQCEDYGSDNIFSAVFCVMMGSVMIFASPYLFQHY